MVILKQYVLVTAEVIYRLPDRPVILQSFIWQDMDTIPKLPILHKFLTFWEEHIEGRIHTVRVGTRGLFKDDVRMFGAEFSLH